MGYTVLRLGALEWSTPSAGDQSRGIVRLSDELSQMRANIWRMPAESRGRRHVELVQEEVFVVLAGTGWFALGDPPETIEAPAGSVVLLEAGTAVQLGASDEDAIILALGAPPVERRAEYLPDA